MKGNCFLSCVKTSLLQVLEQTGGIPSYYKDYKDLMDLPEVHAVIIG